MPLDLMFGTSTDQFVGDESERWAIVGRNSDYSASTVEESQARKFTGLSPQFSDAEYEFMSVAFIDNDRGNPGWHSLMWEIHEERESLLRRNAITYSVISEYVEGQPVGPDEMLVMFCPAEESDDEGEGWETE